MDNKTTSVKIYFNRKRAFSGALLTYKLFINGEYVGNLKNGKKLTVDVPKTDFYFIDERWAFYERNGIIRAADFREASEIFVEIRRVGGWRTNSYNEFYLKKNDKFIQLPSFDYSFYYQACFNNKLFSKLTEQEKTLTLCLAFFEEVSDGVDEVLYNEKLYEMLDALQSVGAIKYYKAMSSVISRTFEGISLPLNDEAPEDKIIQKRLAEANNIVWDMDKNGKGSEELHKCIVSYITEYLLR